jgi:hypothetical protein
MQHHRILQVSFVFRLENIGSTDFAATTDLRTNLGQVSFFFVFREEPGLLLQAKGRRPCQEKNKEQHEETTATTKGPHG